MVIRVDERDLHENWVWLWSLSSWIWLVNLLFEEDFSRIELHQSQLLKTSQSQQSIVLFKVSRNQSTSSPDEVSIMQSKRRDISYVVRQTIILYYYHHYHDKQQQSFLSAFWFYKIQQSFYEFLWLILVRCLLVLCAEMQTELWYGAVEVIVASQSRGLGFDFQLFPLTFM